MLYYFKELLNKDHNILKKIGKKAEQSRSGDSASKIPGICLEWWESLKIVAHQIAQRYKYERIKSEHDDDRQGGGYCRGLE